MNEPCTIHVRKHELTIDFRRSHRNTVDRQIDCILYIEIGCVILALSCILFGQAYTTIHLLCGGLRSSDHLQCVGSSLSRIERATTKDSFVLFSRFERDGGIVALIFVRRRVDKDSRLTVMLANKNSNLSCACLSNCESALACNGLDLSLPLICGEALLARDVSGLLPCQAFGGAPLAFL